MLTLANEELQAENIHGLKRAFATFADASCWAHRPFNPATQQFLTGIAEQFFALWIDKDNLAQTVHHHHCVRVPILEDLEKAFVA